MDRESMATVLVNAYKLDMEWNSKLPKRICWFEKSLGARSFHILV